MSKRWYARVWRAYNRFNEKVAVAGTNAFGSMHTFWIFLFMGLYCIPENWKWGEETGNLSSKCIQLCSLPLLAVGSIVLGRAQERRQREHEELVRKEFQLIREEMGILQEMKADLLTIKANLV